MERLGKGAGTEHWVVLLFVSRTFSSGLPAGRLSFMLGPVAGMRILAESRCLQLKGPLLGTGIRTEPELG